LMDSISRNEMFVWNMETYVETIVPETFHIKSNDIISDYYIVASSCALVIN
jgi:hypothetical protein